MYDSMQNNKLDSDSLLSRNFNLIICFGIYLDLLFYLSNKSSFNNSVTFIGSSYKNIKSKKSHTSNICVRNI